MQYLKIHDWDEWQSYRKDRGQPPWIKIHRCLMRNMKWVSMSDSERGQLVAIWLLAADHNGQIPSSPDVLQKLCFMEKKPNINKFIELGFIDNDGCHRDAKMTPDGCHGDAPDKSRDRVEESRDRVETEGRRVFDHWKITMNHPKSVFDDKRKKLISTWVKAGYTETDLISAITGCSLTPHNMGKNDRNERYDSLELILRDASHIDRFMKNAISPPMADTKLTGNGKKAEQVINNWLEKKQNEQQ